MSTDLFSQMYEISPRFRRSLETRVSRLERDAATDEQTIELLRDSDHIRRHRRLVVTQRSEAARIRDFLDRSRTGSPDR